MQYVKHNYVYKNEHVRHVELHSIDRNELPMTIEKFRHWIGEYTV